MPEGFTLLNLEAFSKPATLLIEKIAEGIGGYYKPTQIRRVGQAEADVNKMHALANIEIDELQRRALSRFIVEEAQKQTNIEAVAAKAMPLLEKNADARQVDN